MLSDLDLDRFHHLAQAAVDDMRLMARRHRRTMTEFSERQLVHSLGSQLRRLGLWVAFEPKYLKKQRGYEKKRADIFATERSPGRPEHLWIEIKSTGLTDTGRWDNSFANLGWEDDFEKLRTRDNRVDGASNVSYWAWLYLFEYAEAKLKANFPRGRSWSPPLPLADMAAVFGRVNANNWTLGRTLKFIGNHKWVRGRARCSIMPHIPDEARDKPHSALLVTVRIK